MIVRCPDCLAKYEIAAGRIPEEGVRVRCPKCKAVFPVLRPGDEPAVAPSRPSAAQAAAPAEAPLPEPRSMPAMAMEPSLMDEEPPPPRPSRRITDPTVAQRLARAILQEMLLARRPEHRKAVEEGALLSRFGAAILICRGLYLEKVSPDLMGAEGIFLDAVRDVVGEGKAIF